MMKLDESGRCCNHKPLVYKRIGEKCCVKCRRAYDIDTGEQIENWAWKPFGDEWVRVDSYGNPIV